MCASFLFLFPSSQQDSASWHSAPYGRIKTDDNKKLLISEVVCFTFAAILDGVDDLPLPWLRTWSFEPDGIESSSAYPAPISSTSPQQGSSNGGCAISHLGAQAGVQRCQRRQQRSMSRTPGHNRVHTRQPVDRRQSTSSCLFTISTT